MTIPTHNTDDPPPPYSADDPHPTSIAITSTGAKTAQPISYHIYRAPFGSSYKIYKDDIAQKFRVDRHKIRRPDLVVSLETPPLSGLDIAHVNFSEWTDACDVGLFREPNNKRSAVWTRITGDRRFSALVPVLDPNGNVVPNTSVRRSWVWKGSVMSSCLLEDEEDGIVAATIYKPPYLPLKAAVVEILLPFSEPFITLVLTTYLAILEKPRVNTKFSSTYHGRRHNVGARATQMSLLASAGASGGIGGAGA